jgi:hypothetical protein
MNKITINAQGGTMTLDGDARPSTDDKTDIISSLTWDDDDGAEFKALCDASCAFDAEATVSEFIARCERWLAVSRNVPTV